MRIDVQAFEGLGRERIVAEERLSEEFDARTAELARPMVEALGYELLSACQDEDGITVRVKPPTGKSEIWSGERLVKRFLAMAAEEAFPT